MQQIVNKKALHDFFILESIEAGIVLNGGEVKSIKLGRADLNGAHIRVINKEAFLINANIPLYQASQDQNYQPTRTRKLLLHRSQIDSLMGRSGLSGVTLVPVSIYEKNNLLKVQVGLARSKRQFDKRKILKKRAEERDLERQVRGDKYQDQKESRR